MGEEMQARPYQNHIERQCMAQNTIIFLPTGSGKTFIAVQIIKRHQKDIQLLYSRGGKRTFYLVNSVVLVEQQVKVLQDLTNLSVHGYSSQDKVDLWCLGDWQKELERVQIMVMTSQILVDMLNHNYVPLEKINLLVFDECHHGVDDHPMRQIMKAFERVPKKLHPKIIGLTATLLNKNIKPDRVLLEIRELEKTYNAMICSTDPEHFSQVLMHSTNPKEHIITYLPPTPLGVEQVTLAGLHRLCNVVAIMTLEPCAPSSRLPNAVKMKAKPDKIKKFIKSCIESVTKYFEDFGVYGVSLALLAYTVSSERLKLHADTAARQAALQLAITSFSRARAVLERAMANHSGLDKIERFCSPRVRHVLNILKEYSPRYMASDAVPKYNIFKESLSAMVFVQERFASKVLSTILKHAAANCPELEYLKVDFAVGFNVNPYSDTREGLYEKKQNKEVVMKFASQQLNCLVCTQVMEEGMDVPRCTLVLRFDPILNYRSYIQAKGRGRHKKAVYAMLVAKAAMPKFNANYEDFKKIENLLNNVLVNDVDGRTVPSTAELNEKFRKLCPPYVCGNASVTLDTAMSLVHRYCNSLPHDKFTCLQPEWFQMQLAKEDKTGVYQVSVLLPPFCPIKEPIKGVALMGLRNAKKAAALKACEQLHKAGELTDKLLPRDRFSEVLDPKIESMFFSHWKPQPEDDNSTLGTKRNKRVYNKMLPACLRGVATAGLCTYYLHGICTQPVREDPTAEALYSLLEQDAGLLVLTQSPLPELPPFRLYLSSGEIMVQLMVNQKTITLTKDQLNDIKVFHCLLFSDVLGIAKSFMCWDGGSGPSSYLVAASQGAGPSLGLDWEVIWGHTSMESCVEPEVDTRRATRTDPEYYSTSVVEPWYRSGQQTRYIVVKVCDHMTPSSPFCDPAIKSFAAYYETKYKLRVLGPPDQPMLQVRYLSRKMNALLPRAITLKSSAGTGGSSRYKRHQDSQGAPSDEHLVPEFCVRYRFPGLLWLKGTLLPAVLHRMTMLLQCDELRRSIAEESGLGLATLPPGKHWEVLHCDVHAVRQSQKKESSGASKERQPSPPEEPMEVEGALSVAMPGSGLREDNYLLVLKKLQTEFPWEQNLEPVDIERNFDTVTVADIECYENFVLQKVDSSPTVNPSPSKPHSSIAGDQIKAARAICAPPYKYNDNISILSIRASSALGPQLGRILEALTAAKSNDTVNLERLETLGDAFLKFSISLVLLHTFPNYHEGQLTNLKGRIVSNKNLYFCGLEKDLPGRMKVDNFTPKADGSVPSFTVPKPLKNLIIDAEVCPSVLYSLSFPRQEVLSGKLSPGSWQQVSEAFKKWAEQGEEAGPQRFVEGMDSFLGRQAIMDKMVADSVEALIGVYLLDGGTTAGLRLLQWLKVLPGGEHWLDLLTLKLASPLDNGATSPDQVAYLLDYTGPQIEEIVGYNFKDPCLLLQAMSHSSNLRNRVTDSYQRLEFLGDAVLDFLVTCHLYEHCGQLSPGDLTDLRSALVNNNTLACLVVRLGLHKFLQTSSVGLDVAIAKFSQYQLQRDHVIDESILFLLQEDDCNLAEYIEVPKVLGDLLESIAGAIFLDSGGDLATVWRVFYCIMHKEIAMFSENVPKNPIRMLYENIHASAVFKPSEPMGNGTMMVPVELRVAGRATLVHGFGKNTAQARRAAAKVALRMLDVAHC